MVARDADEEMSEVRSVTLVKEIVETVLSTQHKTKKKLTKWIFLFIKGSYAYGQGRCRRS